MTKRPVKIASVVGTRPNLVKIAPLLAAFATRDEIESVLVHTGQHYDAALSDRFFGQLGIPEPDCSLGVGSGTHAAQTAAIMKAFEPVVVQHRPDAVLVVGDVNSTVACSLVAAKLGVAVVHVEAGLRSFDRTMPEEINRVVTDAISDLLLCSEPSGVANLRTEGVAETRIHLVGNLMIDALHRHRATAEMSRILDDLALAGKRYAVLTLHRPSNVDDPEVLGGILDALEAIGRELPVVFPVHPRTRAQIERFGLGPRADATAGLRQLEPVSYLDFLKLVSSAAVVLTDSGGIQEETTVLGIPCLTLRDNTERPITVEMGTNQLVGNDPRRIVDACVRAMRGERSPAGVPPLWDGATAGRIADILVREL